ncbi:hypothetical protein MMC13_003343 [Lambiella insularis]|nr:hypothetical protein [Lambiella insularis]
MTCFGSRSELDTDVSDEEDSVTIANLRAQLAREERRRREEEEKRQAAEASLDALTRRTTFEELPADTRGGVTNPRHRITPTLVAPWGGFKEEQAATYQEFCQAFQNEQLFPTEPEVLSAQKTINEFLITSEKGLTNFTDVAKVTPIKEIVNNFIAFAPSDSVPGPEVSFRPRGDPDDGTKAAFAPVDGVWIRGMPSPLIFPNTVARAVQKKRDA